MSDVKSVNLASSLTDRVELLELCRDAQGGFTWVSIGSRYAAVKQDAGSNIFSKVGIGARGVTITLRPCPRLTLHHAFRWRGRHLFLTALLPSPAHDRLEVKAALCDVVTFTAEPQAKTGRDKLNRPTVEKVAAYTFPGVLTELYSKMEDEVVVITEAVQRVLVTSKEISLRKGDLVRHPSGRPYVVQRVLDLDEFKNEYIVYYQEDV